MIPKTVDGVPAHPLIIHIPVMLGPLVGILCLLLLVPKLRAKIYIWTAVLGVLLAISAVVAVASGHNFEKVLQLGPLIKQHEDSAELFRTMTIVLAVLLIGYVFVVRKLGSRAALAGAVVVAALGVVEVAQVVKVGHEGASQVWKVQYQNALDRQNSK